MKDNIVKIEHLSHRYSTSWAIRDINLEVQQTGIIGLLGANGAGKSTTMNILCGSLRQTEGRIYINGIDMAKDPIVAKQQIGFLPQIAPLHLDFTVDEYLKFCAGLRGVNLKELAGAMEYAKERCGIAQYGKRVIRNLSGGYRQRVGIAQAIIHKPKLIVLDEPTNGLDPNQIMEVRGLIKDIAEEHAVILSTHILSEVQAMCRDIRMIDNGRIVFADTMDAFNNYMAPHSLFLRLENPPSHEQLTAIPGVSKVDFITEKRIKLYFEANTHDSDEIIGQLVERSVKGGWQLKEINPDKHSLDEIFAELSSKIKKN